jgi:uncharacterized phiE125 gp8 family phage protein
MALSVVTAPAAEPITLSEAKAQLRVTHGHEDALISSLISAARELVEQRTWRQLVTATFRLYLDRFPAGREILLPRPRLVSIASIDYLTDGEWVSLSGGQYSVDAVSEPGRVLVDTDGWPEPDDTNNAVRIQFTAGYGAASAVPESIKSAIKVLITGLYDNRDDLPLKTERAFQALIAPFCVRDLGELPYLVGSNLALDRAEGLA